MKKDCYCNDQNAAREEGLPPGYCGFCDVCGRAGHIRHFPGASPQTGGWCDCHYKVAACVSPNGRYGIFLWVSLTAAILILEVFLFLHHGLFVLIGLGVLTFFLTFIVQNAIYLLLMRPKKSFSQPD